MSESSDKTKQNRTELIVEAIREKKGKQIVIIDLSGVEKAICDTFVICHGESTTQVGALADWVEEKVKRESGERPHHIEGLQNSQWVLLDYFDCMVHIFLEEQRSFFNLEELWADGKVKHLKDE
ncbi:MAG: ribosome silencing factor [Bacteroidota bacterium]